MWVDRQEKVPQDKMLIAKNLLDYPLLRLREQLEKLGSLGHSLEYFAVVVLSNVQLVLVSVLRNQQALDSKVYVLAQRWSLEEAFFWKAEDLGFL